MLGEIDWDFYCAADAYSCNAGWCVQVSGHTCDEYPECHNRKHKYPTPEQYKAEYGEEYPDDGAVYVSNSGWGFMVETYASAKKRIKNVPSTKIVCAVTPWGIPPDDWRPE